MNALASYAYYPGCSQNGSAVEYDLSTRAVLRDLGVALEEVPDWSCCGSSPAHAIDGALSAALCARNLNLILDMGMRQATTPCPSCLSNLRAAEIKTADPAFKARTERLLGAAYPGGVECKSTLQVLLEDVGPERVANRTVLPLTGLKAVCYYGCLTTRLKATMNFDDEENPTSMETLLRAAGAEVLDFPLKTECCGASLAIPVTEAVTTLGGRLLNLIDSLDADVIAVACPLCHMNLDLRRGQINRAMGKKFTVPVLYFTQLLGLAMGFAPKKLGLDKLCVDPRAVVRKVLRKE